MHPDPQDDTIETAPPGFDEAPSTPRGPSSGAKAFAFVVLLFGGCGSLGTACEIAGSVPMLTASDDAARASLVGKQLNLKLEPQQAEALSAPLAEVSMRWTKILLVGQVPYLLAALAGTLLVALMLAGRGRRLRSLFIGAALVASLARIGMGLAEYQMIEEVLGAMTPVLAAKAGPDLGPDATLQQRAQAAREAGRREEAMKKAMSLAQGVGGAVRLGVTLTVVLVWLMAAAVLGRVAPPAPSAAGSPPDGGGLRQNG